jgi:hypothetical protein
VVRERNRGLSLGVAIDRVTAEPSGPPSQIAAAGEPAIGERARAYLDRIPDSSRRSQLRLAGAITARAFATT